MRSRTIIPAGTGLVENGSASARDEGGDDIAGVAVEVVASSVIAGGGAGVGVARGDLDVSKGYAGVEGCGDEAVAQAREARCAW
jgi:hypothetical protein